MTIPAILAAAIKSLPPNDRIDLHGPWTGYPDGRWAFPMTARLSVAPGNGIPDESGWQIHARGYRGSFRIRIYPDAATGISATYAHQSCNRENPDGNPWRLGKPCLNRPVGAFRRDNWADEPSGVAECLGWMIERLLSWIDAAATDSLIRQNEPFELPTRVYERAAVVIGFRETPEGYGAWMAAPEKWGYARINKVRGAIGAEVVALFLNRDPEEILKIQWGAAIVPDSGPPNAVWCRLPAAPILPPWQFPETWQDLVAACAAMGTDLPAMIADAASRLRRLDRYDERKLSRLLIGFPIAKKMSATPDRLHWLAIDQLELTGRLKLPRGTDFGAERRARDIAMVSADRPLIWWPTSNWASDELRNRGAADDAVQAKSVLIIGCGAIGAPVADMLLRIGVTRLGVMDGDRVEAGNLCRHILSTDDVGHFKANALARRLSTAMPDADIKSLRTYFPPIEDSSRLVVQGFDVIVDCTGSDEVLDALAAYPWNEEKIFISLGMTWAAEGLVAFAASESIFPSLDARSFFAEVAPHRPDDEMPMEGLGCWHPVFPARANDTMFWASQGVSFIQQAMLERSRKRVHYRRTVGGGVERDDH